ncbi:hypothetical protein BYT27DRAFT_7230489 [Phlegmacium glaucopus]|nr:hypothetical protein BYT27DRAFT_7230489 [Phlegmacium glaucopus]
MLDDDIVYLGTRNNASTPPGRSPQRPVTGIALHIEKSGGIEAYGMLFRRTNTSVVHIGRRSGFDSDRRSEDAELGNAMFRCAVVSRKHAKIAFSDSGLAYLIDLGSHHGTHIRKPGERFSRPLKPETPSLLADGDIVTFGKSVGKNEECVKPVVARIELLFSGHNGTHSTSPIKPLVVPCNSSSSSEKSSVKSNSGRFGVNDTSSSSDESSFNSGMYSDIEEIPAPTTSSSKAVTSQNPPCSTSSFLKRLLPPSHSPGAPRRDFLPSLSEIVERPLAHVSMFLSAFGPESVPTSPNVCNFSPLPPIHDLERSTSPLAFTGSDFLPVGFDASQHDIYEISDHVASKSRSHSPMDLASPSPPREVIPLTSIQPPQLITLTKQLDVPNLALDGPSSSSSFENNAVASENAVIEGSADGGEAASALPSDALPPSDMVGTRDSASTSAQMKKFEELLEKLQFDVSKLHNHRRKYKARFNSNVEVISGKLAQFDDRLAEVDAEYTMLFDQVDTIHHVDIPDLQTQLGALQERVDDLPDPFSTPDPRECTPQPVLHEREDVKANIQALQSLVDEMQILQETSRVQMAAEIEAIKVMRETAMADIAEAQVRAAKASQVCTKTSKVVIEHCFTPLDNSQTPVLLSLKRKRDDTDENEEVDDIQQDVDFAHVECSFHLANQDKDVVMDEEVPSTKLDILAAAPGTAATHRQLDVPPPRKRARRIASVLAQTATAVTIGAVVTWSALAFS